MDKLIHTYPQRDSTLVSSCIEAPKNVKVKKSEIYEKPIKKTLFGSNQFY